MLMVRTLCMILRMILPVPTFVMLTVRNTLSLETLRQFSIKTAFSTVPQTEYLTHYILDTRSI